MPARPEILEIVQELYPDAEPLSQIYSLYKKLGQSKLVTDHLNKLLREKTPSGITPRQLSYSGVWRQIERATYVLGMELANGNGK